MSQTQTCMGPSSGSDSGLVLHGDRLRFEGRPESHMQSRSQACRFTLHGTLAHQSASLGPVRVPCPVELSFSVNSLSGHMSCRGVAGRRHLHCLGCVPVGWHTITGTSRPAYYRAPADPNFDLLHLHARSPGVASGALGGRGTHALGCIPWTPIRLPWPLGRPISTTL